MESQHSVIILLYTSNRENSGKITPPFYFPVDNHIEILYPGFYQIINFNKQQIRYLKRH